MGNFEEIKNMGIQILIILEQSINYSILLRFSITRLVKNSFIQDKLNLSGLCDYFLLTYNLMNSTISFKYITFDWTFVAKLLVDLIAHQQFLYLPMFSRQCCIVIVFYSYYLYQIIYLQYLIVLLFDIRICTLFVLFL